ncbi:barwin-like endoglucanase [Massarina eburnea CBS 473.64]|uniref:Barwin-like endoglucanase n=1 Tax=Massarina eburnea CBS 473.64 TaxID=1395130 RepID=A0A6A6RUN1_9PLEO|nr:barwin-like endoglucanase [Massarina eburnea CBS 473.64]
MSSASAVAAAQSTTSRVEPQRPAFPQPFGNGTFANNTRFPTHTPVRPTGLQTRSSVLPSLSSTLLSAASSSSKQVKTVVVTPVPVSDASQSATAAVSSSSVAASSSAAASAAPSVSPAEDVSSASATTGTATFYGGNLSGGTCSFTDYTIPSGLYGTAFGGNWDASACGQCVSVTGPNGNTIKAMVVDQCPECDASHLDLFENAFTQIGDKSAGTIDISYSVVPCGISSPLVLKMKSGSSQYFFSMQVVNSNVAISKLEISTDGGSSWKSTTRQTYNFFEISSGSGSDTVDVRVTSVGGKTITVNSVSVADSATKTADSNFSS